MRDLCGLEFEKKESKSNSIIVDVDDDSSSSFLQTPRFRESLEQVPDMGMWEKIRSKSKCDGRCVICDINRFSYKGNKYQTKRIIFEWFVSCLNEGDIVKNTCKRKNCIFPLHLSKGKRNCYSDNVWEMWKNRKQDCKLSRRQRAEKYNMPIYVVEKKDQGLSHRHLVNISQEEDKEEAPILIPQKVLILFDKAKQVS